MDLKQVLTSQSCTVEFPKGNEVGYLQNLTIQASYNLQPIKNLYEHTIQYYAQGISIYSVTAQRAFVELNSMFGKPDSLLNVYDQFQKAKNILKEETSASDQLASLAAGVGLAIKYGQDIIDGVSQKGLDYFSDKIKDIFNSQTDPNDLFTQMLEFEVLVKNPLIKLPEIIPEGFSNIVDKMIGSSNTLFTLSGCKINARNISIAPGNIAVLENVTITPRKMTDTLFSRQQISG
jgi:hypothetical protein